MRYFLILVGMIFLAAMAAWSEDASPVAPAIAEPKPSVSAQPAPAVKTETPAEVITPVETPAAPKAEPKAAPALEPVAAPEPEVKPKPKSVAGKPSKKARAPVVVLSAEEIGTRTFQALKAAVENSDGELRAAALDDLRVFAEQHPDAPEAPEALSILARQGDYRQAMVDWLRLAYEYPDSEFAQRAKSEYLDLVNKKMRSKLQPGLNTLAKTPEDTEKADRLAQMIYGLSENSGDVLYEPLVAAVRRFQVRFSDYKDSDRILWCLAQLHMANGKLSAVVMVYRELLVREGSPYQEKAQFAMADLYAEKLKKYKDAVDAYQGFVERYPGSERVLSALEKLAAVYADKLEQYPLAVETYERIIKLFPKSEGALRAFNAEAKTQRERLKQPDEAVKTYQRLAAQFLYPQAAEALMAAAEVCRKDLQDYKREVGLRCKIASDFPTAKEAPEQLYRAAEITEVDLKDDDGAIKLYQQVASQFAVHKLGKKAAQRAVKLEKKKSGG